MNSIDPQHIQNIIVTGKSGAGKQPRIDVLIKEYSLQQLSTGDIFRKYLRIFNDFGFNEDLSIFWDEDKDRFKSDSEIKKLLQTTDDEVVLGLKAKYFVDKGLFVPDYITNALFQAAFADKQYTHQVLDGYPRTVDQAIFLIDIIKQQQVHIDFIVLVDNTDDRIIQRTVQRRICPQCGKVYHLQYKPPVDGNCSVCGIPVIQRSDDTKEKITSRLQEFQEKTVPAIEYLKDRGIPLVKVPGHLEKFTDENVRKSVLDAVHTIE